MIHSVLAGLGSASDLGIPKVSLNSAVSSILKALVFVAGTLAVVLIVVAGLLYVLSSGDPGKVKRAKDTLLYAIVGLVIAISAQLLVSFVITSAGV